MIIDTPLRITWNALAPQGGEESLRLVGERVIAAQVLQVSVRLCPEMLSRHADLLGRIAAQARLEVVLDADSPGTARCESLETLAAQAPGRVAVVWDCTSGLGGERWADLPTLPAGVEGVVAACPDAGNLREVVDLARAAARRGVRCVSFTHPDLAGCCLTDCDLTARCRRRTPTEYHLRRLLADDPGLLSLAAELKHAGCKLLVHDLFLSRVLLGAWPTGYGGCQAGATMAHVDAAGNVYPCSALPVALGNLSVNGLDEIWAAKERAALRSMIETPGPLCASCGDYPACRGGCRGLSYVINGSWEHPDPACPVTATPA